MQFRDLCNHRHSAPQAPYHLQELFLAKEQISTSRWVSTSRMLNHSSNGHEHNSGSPKASLSFPGPSTIISLARYSSPNPCLPIQMGIFQPRNVIAYASLSKNTEIKSHTELDADTWNNAWYIPAYYWFTKNSSYNEYNQSDHKYNCIKEHVNKHKRRV